MPDVLSVGESRSESRKKSGSRSVLAGLEPGAAGGRTGHQNKGFELAGAAH